MTQQTQVQAVNHKDVNGKDQLYIIIDTEKGRVVINVGEKTFKNVKNITEGQIIEPIKTIKEIKKSEGSK